MSDPAGGEAAGPLHRLAVEQREFAASVASAIKTAGTEADDRSWIARRVIWLFTAIIGMAEGVFLVQGLRTGAWDDVARQTAELIRSAVLPIVTLILGYYFGCSGRI